MNQVAPIALGGTICDLLGTLIAADGTQGHAYATLDSRSPLIQSIGNLADAVHYLTMLHGRHPGVVDHAATRTAENAAREWLLRSSEGFVAERAYLTQITVALGPPPSTTGQDQSEATVVQQRHALDMLAQSDRRGCAMGAAMALVLDWKMIRRILDAAAMRVGIEPRPAQLPDMDMTLSIAEAIVGDDDGIGRAVQFGARQLLRQHRGLWDLLQARASVRAES